MAVSDRSGKSRIVIFGGTFDPIHNGHIAIARCLRDELSAEKVLMVPAGQPWLREGLPLASAQERLRMVALATEGEDRIEVSDVDVVRRGTTYSLDTIRDLRDIYGPHSELILAVGADAASTLHRWHRHEELLEACTIAIVERPGALAETRLTRPPGTITIRGPMINVSGSEIRRLYADGELTAAADRVPPMAHRFIIENRLYRCIPPTQ